MRRLPSIQKKITSYAILGLSGLAIFFVMAVSVNAYWQKLQQMEKLEVQMLATSEGQAQRILGTLLLPEERNALPMILDQIKKQEGLLAISVNQFGHLQKKQVPGGCRQMTANSFICNDHWDNEVRSLSRLEHGGRVYGELSKTKVLPAASVLSLADPQLWLLVFSSITLVAVSLLVIRFIRKELCGSVQEIVTGLEQGKEARRHLVRKQSFRELRHLARALYGLQSQVEQKSLKESLGEMSRQVAHDLRSPLSLLKVVTATSHHPMTDSEKRLATQAVKRLEQIADTLLKADQSAKASFNTHELGRIIESLLEEKRYSEKGRVDFIFENKIKTAMELSSDAESISRTLSNLIDNSIEATEGQASASVRLTLSHDVNNSVFIEILDTGIGMDDQILSPSSSKKYGHGLGVKAARKDLVSQNGALAYNSLVGAGTATRIRVA